MNWNWFCYKFFLLSALLVCATFSMIQGGNVHMIGKRQIGVLARTGALPQGKRSVEVLARNGELPPLGGKKVATGDQSLDSLIEELETAENLSRLRARVLAEKLSEENAGGGGADAEKRSVAALARNGDFPQKRVADFGSRSGYLVKPPRETARPSKDPFDPDDFLGTGKRASVFGRNFFPWRKDVRPQADPYGNKIRGPFRASGGPRDWVDGFDSDDFDVKKNVGATKNFGKREIRGNCLRDSGEGRGRAQPARDAGAAAARTKRYAYWGPAEDEADADADAYADEDVVEKRFLGRIPQLGRIHQKMQSPSMRRRPHLRPSWF